MRLDEINAEISAVRSDWKIFKNGEISFCLITKFDLCCVIKENELIFGFGDMDIIHP